MFNCIICKIYLFNTVIILSTLGALVSQPGLSRLILPEAGKSLVSNIFKPTGDRKVARIARKKLSGHMENNLAEYRGKNFLRTS